MKNTNRYQHLTLLTAVIIAVILSVFIGSCAKKSKDTAIGSSAAPVADGAPVLVSPSNQIINEGQVLTFTLSATDPDNDTIVYTMTSTPTAISATLNSGTGAFSWRPAFSQVGAYNVEFIATANGLTDSETITITANRTLFSSDGVSVSYRAAGGYGTDEGKATAIDASGKILVTGISHNGTNRDMTIWRYNADGTPDTTFGAPNGFVTHHNAAGGNSDDYGNAITVTASGKILVTGYSISGNPAMTIWRYNADGTLDTTFSSDGIVIYNATYAIGNAITIGANDKILVAGTAGAGNQNMYIWRYNDNGTLDTTFDTDGMAVYDGPGGYPDCANAIALDANGKIVVAGYRTNSVSPWDADLLICRYYITGTLDTTFGISGIAVYSGTANASDRGSAMTINANGKILVTGNSQNSSNYDMFLWRYTSTGTLDTTFDTDGIVSHNSAAGGNSVDWGYAITVTAAGKILVAGISTNVSGNRDLAIWRYNDDGTIDTSFDTDGFVVNDGANGVNSTDYCYGMAIDADGKIVVAGSSAKAGSGYSDMAIWRFDADGTLDTTFDSDGIVIRGQTAGGNGFDYGNAIATDAQGRILITGNSMNSLNKESMVIWRYNDDGTLDTSFDTDGIAIYEHAADGTARDCNGKAITVTASGKILVTGYSDGGTSNYDMTIWCYNDDGTLDNSFGTGGVVTHTNAANGDGDDCGNAITLDASGKILVAGYSDSGANSDDLAIWRYTSDGELDDTFNSVGFVTHHGAAGGTGNDWGNAITLDASGNILVAGYSRNASFNYDMAIWRYTPAGALDNSFNSVGFTAHHNAAGGNNNDYGTAITLDAAGKILVAGYSRNTNGNYDMAIWRYTPAGALDTANFGSPNGFITHHNAAGGEWDDYGYAIAIDAQGKILVAGNSGNINGYDETTIWRYNADGTLDTTFSDGCATYNSSVAGFEDYNYGTGMTLDANGKILVAGYRLDDNGYNSGTVVWRYLPTGDLDGTNWSNPILTDSYDTTGIAYDAQVSGWYAYVADGLSGLQIVYIADPENISLSGSLDTAGDARGIYLAGTYAYVADSDSGLQIINISNPSIPVQTGSYDTAGTASGVYVVGSYAYVADGASGLQIIDISNPSTPTLAGSYNTTGTASGVHVVGSYAYVADGTSGLQIINISNPSTPTLAGSLDTTGSASGVYVVGSYAYVADGASGLQIIDISNPALPTLVSSYATPNFAQGLYVVGIYAYVADGTSGLQIINCTNPALPALADSYDTTGTANNIFVVGKHVYVVDGSSGLHIIKEGN
jgi:uncharacterized delta-60 repeat protein